MPHISLHAPSSTSIKTVPKLSTFESKFQQSTSDIQSGTNQIVPPKLPFNPARTGEPNPTTNSQTHKGDLNSTSKSPDDFESAWNLDDINRFTREIFKQNTGNTSYLTQ